MLSEKTLAFLTGLNNYLPYAMVMGWVTAWRFAPRGQGFIASWTPPVLVVLFIGAIKLCVVMLLRTLSAKKP